MHVSTVVAKRAHKNPLKPLGVEGTCCASLAAWNKGSTLLPLSQPRPRGCIYGFEGGFKLIVYTQERTAIAIAAAAAAAAAAATAAADAADAAAAAAAAALGPEAGLTGTAPN